MKYQLTVHDYKLRYLNTYLKHKDGYIYVTSVEEVNDKPGLVGYFKSFDLEEEPKEARFQVGDEALDYKFPQLGALNTQGGFVLYVSRVRAKQWRIALTEKSIQVTDPLVVERDLLNVANFRGLGNWSFLLNLFHNKLYSMDEAEELVLSGKRVAAAFHPHYYFGFMHRSNRVCVFRKQFPVAHLNKQGDLVLSKDLDFLKEELTMLKKRMIIL